MVLPKFKMATTDQLQFFGGRKILVWSIFLEILTKHSQQHGDVQVIF